MNGDIASRVTEIKDRFGGCFGCGPHNPIGLQLDDFVMDGRTVRCQWTPRLDYQSFPGVVHGGVVTAALDEIMAWTAMLVTSHTVVTGTMELRFRTPAATQQRMLLEATIDDHRGRRVMLSAAMRDEDGATVASANAMFITLDPIDSG